LKVFILDNYDSFTYNLVHLVEAFTDDYCVRRNDKFELSDIEVYDKILLSPGPGLPKDAGLMPAVIKEYHKAKDILGVCLGMQAIGEAFGAQLLNLDKVLHGMQTPCDIQPSRLFKGLSDQIEVGHYHSWVVDQSTLPSTFKPTAISQDGLLMAMEHEEYKLAGVQFHPESVLTPDGKKIIENWLFS